MKKNIVLVGSAVVIVLVVLFFVLKPAAPDFGSIAIVTQDDTARLPLPQLTGTISRYMIAPESVLSWTGRKVGGEHYGVVPISHGGFAVDEGDVAAGKFVIAMTSIAIHDMEPSHPMYNQLSKHLSDGFFAVDQYPTAVFDLKQLIQKTSDMYQVIGDLTIKGVNREIMFPAQIVLTEDIMTVKANFFVDRTAWGINEVIQIADKYIEFGMDFVFERVGI